jgi:hypothetical protein
MIQTLCIFYVLVKITIDKLSFVSRHAILKMGNHNLDSISKEILGKIDQDSSLSKSNWLHVVIIWLFFIGSIH